MGAGSERHVASSAMTSVGRAARAFVTRALLVIAIVVWSAAWSLGVPPLAASALGSALVVGGLLGLEVVRPRPGLDPRAAGTLASDMLATATTTVVALGLPSFV